MTRSSLARRSTPVSAALALAMALAVGRAHADDAEARAAALATEARAADQAGDPVRAAHLLADADRAAPSPLRLTAAIEAALKAQEPPLAMALVERAGARAWTPALEEAVRRTRDRYGLAVAFVRVLCVTCTATLDGQPIPEAQRVVVSVGRHLVVVTEGEREHRWPLTLSGGQERELVPRWLAASSTSLPAESAAPLSPDVAMPLVAATPIDAGPALAPLDPGWFWAGVGVTGAATWMTVLSALDAAGTRDRDDGRHPFFQDVDAARADHRTVLLGSAAAACALGTAALGLFAVEWGGDDGEGDDGGGAVRVSGPGLSVDGHF